MSSLGPLLPTILVIALSRAGLASPPAPNAPEPEQDGPITVEWESEINRPSLIAWPGSARKPVEVDGQVRRVRLPRPPRYGNDRQRLLIIGRGTRTRPAVIEVSPQDERVVYKPERMPEDEAWIWGVTPTDPCGNGAPLNASVRRIDNFKLYSSLLGPFAWRIKRSKESKDAPFYFYGSGRLSAVSSETLRLAGAIPRTHCAAHHGGECRNTLEVPPDAWGRAHRIDFKTRTIPEYACPA